MRRVKPKHMDLVKCETFADIGFDISTLNEKRTGSFVFLCPYCKEPTWVDMDVSISVCASTYTKQSEIKNINSISFDIKCNSCGLNFTTKDLGIDPNMYDIIELVGQYYPTTFSCEGHFNDAVDCNYSRPYLAFESTEVKKYGAPRGWEYDKNLLGSGAVIRYWDKFETLEDKEKAIYNLRVWAEKIASKEFKKQQRKARKEKGR